MLSSNSLEDTAASIFERRTKTRKPPTKHQSEELLSRFWSSSFKIAGSHTFNLLSAGYVAFEKDLAHHLATQDRPSTYSRVVENEQNFSWKGWDAVHWKFGKGFRKILRIMRRQLRASSTQHNHASCHLHQDGLSVRWLSPRLLKQQQQVEIERMRT